MTATIASRSNTNLWNDFCSWVTSTNNRLYVGWFGVLMIPCLLVATSVFGWVVPLSPSALSVGVGVADLSSRVSALSRCSCSDRARLRAHACLAACTVLQRRSRSPRSGGVAAPSRSCGAAALVPWRRSRSPVLRRRSRPHV